MAQVLVSFSYDTETKVHNIVGNVNIKDALSVLQEIVITEAAKKLAEEKEK